PTRGPPPDAVAALPQVRAFGPGLQGGLAGVPAPFTIDTKGAGTGGLGLTVEGPCEAKIECLDNGDGTCSVSYLPTEPGDYNINILFAGAHVPGSPFRAPVRAPFDASKVTCSGPGLEGATAGQPGHFRVDCSRAGTAELTIGIASEAGARAEVRVEDNGDGTYTIAYTPLSPGVYTITVEYGGQPVPHFPSKVRVEPAVDTAGVKVYGPGVEGKGVFREAVTEFDVDARALTKAGGPHVKTRVSNPSGNVTETFVEDRGDGTYHVEYTPYEEGEAWGAHGEGASAPGHGVTSPPCPPPGVHAVEVSYAGSPVPHSPFRVPVTEGCDPARVRVHGPGIQSGTTNQPNKFTVETRGAGTGGLGLAVEGPSEAKMSCTDNKDGSCSVEYVPYEPGTYSLNVTYGGHQVPGSPFKVPVTDVVDSSKVKCAGPGLTPGVVRANVPQTFTVDTSKAGVAPLDVKVQGPKGVVEPVDVADNGDGTQRVSYVPSREGPYSISVRYGDEEVPRSPFKVKALPTHDASKVKASGPGLNTTGVPASLPVEFTIDAKDAGEGLLAVQITPPPPGGPGCGMGEVRASLMPNYPPRLCSACPGARVGGPSGRPLPRGRQSPPSPAGAGIGPTIQIGEETVITVDAKAAGKGKVTCTVCTPDGSEVDVDVVENADGTFDIFYTAPQPGKYVICFYVDYVNSGHVTAYGPGLIHGTVNKPATFTVNTKDAGEGEPVGGPPGAWGPPGGCGGPLLNPVCPPPPGGLSLAVEGPSKAEISCTDNQDGTCSVSYLPVLPGDYSIVVKYNDKHIPGSPFTARITGDDSLRLSHLKVGASADIPLDIGETDLSQLTATVTAPSGRKEPCQLKRLRNGHIGISFVPQEVGEHLVHVSRGGQPLARSPVSVTISQAELGDASRVRVAGPGLREGRTFEPAHFTIDTRDAGYGGLSLSIEGPSKVDITTEELEDGTCRVSYCPTEPGNYIISVKFGDQHVPDPWGAPQIHASSARTVGSLRVPEGRGRLRGQLGGTPWGEEEGPPGDAPLPAELSAHEVTAVVTGPSGQEVAAQVLEGDGGAYSIRFVPAETGVHSVSVKDRGQHVPGSPFQFTVGPMGEGGAHKVRAGGPGLERAEAGVPGE
ncbi:FLNA protein, partial [Oceanites oceanicus]|nr:FLNA protein [Oceanites oceanicus]